jgi:hypothetical protein
LAKQHRNELGPAAKATCVALRLMLSYSGLKLQAGELLQHLRENAAYSIHGGGLLRLLSVLAGTNTTYQSRRLLIPQQLIWTSLCQLGMRWKNRPISQKIRKLQIKANFWLSLMASAR